MFTYVRVAVATAVALSSWQSLRAETVVTTYVTKVQEEKKSTRFTLDEWLKTKERMKMMDVWLAIYGDQAKNQFKPELVASYGSARTDVTVDSSVENKAKSSQLARAQLWLPNLFSSMLGIRTVNIDLGGEVSQRASATLNGAEASGSYLVQHATGNLRLLGKHSQDTSLYLKYGRYNLSEGVLQQTRQKRSGLVAGANLQLYITHAIGLVGGFDKYGNNTSLKEGATFGGQASQYGAFVEVAMLRLTFSRYGHGFYRREGESRKSLSENGYLGEVSVSL